MALMKLHEFALKRGRKSMLATAMKVPSQLVSQWANGSRPIPITRCVAIERATNGAVTRRDLRPDDWHLIWPELATQPKEGEVA